MVKEKITIKDVAKAANVTPQTVSRAFRNAKDISSAMRDKILKIAKSLNYVQNNTAIALRSGSEKKIAVMFDSLKNIYFAIMTDYLEDEIQKRGYSLLTMFKRNHEVNEEMYLSAVSAGANAVISFLQPESSLGEVVRTYGVPLMILGRRTEIQELDYIATDDEQGGRLAAQKLIDSGCKKFAYVAEGMGMTCVIDRLRGFTQVLNESGFDSIEVFDCSNNTIESWLNALIAQDKAPDGIFCFNDMIAFDALSTSNRLGRSQTKIIGYDDIQSDIKFPTRLTTIGIDKQKYAQYIIERLLKKVEGNEEASGRFAEKVCVTLTEGETC